MNKPIDPEDYGDRKETMCWKCFSIRVLLVVVMVLLIYKVAI